MHLGHIFQVFFSVFFFFLYSQRLSFKENASCQGHYKLMGIKMHRLPMSKKNECLQGNQVEQCLCSLETWDVTSVAQSPFP